MTKAERYLWDLDHKLALRSIKQAEVYHTNILLTRLFKPDHPGVINGLNSYRQGLLLLPEASTCYDPIEHSERGNYWCDIRTPLGYFRGWSYDYDYSLLRALISYKLEEVKCRTHIADKVVEILESHQVAA